jgi:hypothetical protein
MLATNGSMRAVAETSAVIVLSVAVVVLMLAPVSNYSAFSSAMTSGDPKAYAWTFAWTSHAILTGEPLFDANILFPAKPALAFAEHYVGVGIWGLPFFALTGNAILVYSILKMLALSLNAVAMYAFVRRWLPGRGPAVIAALVFAVSTPRLLYSGAVPLVWNCWFPLLLITLQRWSDERRWRWIWASSALFVLQALTTWYLAVMAFVVVAVFVAWREASARIWPGTTRHPTAREGLRVRYQWAVTVAQAVAGTACVILAVWPFARPYLALVDAAGPQPAGRYAADMGSYVQPHENALLGPLITRVTGLPARRVGAERAHFLGLVTIALALGGVARFCWLARRRRGDEESSVDVLWGGYFLLVAIVGAGFSFGPGESGSPRLFDLISNAPVLNLFRVPSRFAVLVVFATAGLAALGFAGLQRMGRRVALIAGPLLVPVMLLEWAVVPPANAKPQPDVTPPIYQFVSTLNVHALVSLPCYRGGPSAPLDADYMLYSTTHWRPIVNGYVRAEPRGLGWVVGAVNAFPGPNSAIRMRRLGIDYVIVHTGRYADGAVDILREAFASRDFQLVTLIGGDYLFRVLATR